MKFSICLKFKLKLKLIFTDWDMSRHYYVEQLTSVLQKLCVVTIFFHNPLNILVLLLLKCF